MKTTLIHIEGRVQGVGFRPFIKTLADSLQLKGKVYNRENGVEIEVQGAEEKVNLFKSSISNLAPTAARIDSLQSEHKDRKTFREFSIDSSESNGPVSLSITPDLAICPSCEKEILEMGNRRKAYAFTTCTQCGPRYSVIEGIPYDRELTTMNAFNQCEDCLTEYQSPKDFRFHSQTNSCPSCGVSLSFNAKGHSFSEGCLKRASDFLKKGKIVAVKGIGGYLLMCSASDPKAVEKLREKKSRPRKPLAVLFKHSKHAQHFAYLSENEIDELNSMASPIVIAKSKKSSTKLAWNELTPGLNSIGIMIPYAPLLKLLAESVPFPLVATSANLSGNPILYSDTDAFRHLPLFADAILSHNRKIVTPLDDSVVSYSPKSNQKIVMRFGRGLAPEPPLSPGLNLTKDALALGAMVKSSFAISHKGRVYQSQFLGNTGKYNVLESFKSEVLRLKSLLGATPKVILVDAHPGYPSTQLGYELGKKWNIPVKEIYHHDAHAFALASESPEILKGNSAMFVWDGTGYGKDHNIWGGEFYISTAGGFIRKSHMPYFSWIGGDQMSKNPLFSAWSLAHSTLGSDASKLFELENNQKKSLEFHLRNSNLKTSSMGRLFDAIAWILGFKRENSFEGEAAIYLQSLAENYKDQGISFFQNAFIGEDLSYEGLLGSIINGLDLGNDIEKLAFQFHLTLVELIFRKSKSYSRIGFSGGVFQNTLLVDMIYKSLGDKKDLYFHNQATPNDEGIALGQIMAFEQSLKASQKTESYVSGYSG